MSSGLLQVFVELVDSIKDVVRSSVKVPEFDKHLKKAGGHIGRNNKGEDNSPKTIKNKNHQASSQKVRQLIYCFSIYLV